MEHTMKESLLLLRELSEHYQTLLVISTVKKLLKHSVKELHKTRQTEFRIEKVIKRTGDRRFVKWKDYDNSFNYWINLKDIA